MKEKTMIIYEASYYERSVLKMSKQSKNKKSINDWCLDKLSQYLGEEHQDDFCYVHVKRVPKTKSITDITKQINRIYEHYGKPFSYNDDYTPNNRSILAFSISLVYFQNIINTQEWKDAFQKGFDQEHLLCDHDEAQCRTAGYRSADSIQIHYSIYTK